MEKVNQKNLEIEIKEKANKEAKDTTATITVEIPKVSVSKVSAEEFK